MTSVLIILISVIAAFVAVKWVYFRILKIALDSRIVDNPDARKLQRRPVPVLGGIAVFFGLVVGVLVGASVTWFLSGDILMPLGPALCAMVIMLYAGAMDDMLGLSPKSRFLIEVITILGLIFASGACADSLHGLWGVYEISWWIAVPLTLFAGVGIINAVNMIDGVNGLCSSLCFFCSLMFGLMFIKVEDLPNAVLAFSMAAAVIPFLLHNIFGKKSKMFLGDAGTMMMGVLMVWFTISVLRSESSLKLMTVRKNVNMIAMLLAILSVPVFDTVRVMLLRIYRGKSPFFPDKTHLHHIFVRAGISHSVTTLLELLINILVVGIWALSVKLHCGLDMQLYLVIFTGALLICGVFFFFRWHEKNHTEFMHKMTRFGIKTHLGHSKEWQSLERWLDSPVDAFNIDYPYDDVDLLHDDEDHRKVYDFMKGKAEVYLRNIKERSGVDPEKVDSIVDEGIRDGSIILIRDAKDGTSAIITLKEE